MQATPDTPRSLVTSTTNVPDGFTLQNEVQNNNWTKVFTYYTWYHMESKLVWSLITAVPLVEASNDKHGCRLFRERTSTCILRHSCNLFRICMEISHQFRNSIILVWLQTLWNSRGNLSHHHHSTTINHCCHYLFTVLVVDFIPQRPLWKAKASRDLDEKSCMMEHALVCEPCRFDSNQGSYVTQKLVLTSTFMSRKCQ